MQVKQTKVSAQ